MQAVNLLPADAYAAQHFWSDWIGEGDLAGAKKILIGMGATLGAVVVLVGVLYFHERGVVHHRQATLADVNARLAQAQAAVAKEQAAQALVDSQVSTAKSLTTDRVVWESVMRDLAHVLPSNVWLSTLSVSAPAPPAPVVPLPTDTSGTTTTPTDAAAAAPPPAPAPTTTGFTLAGSTGSQRDVALVLDRLALLPWLSGVTLQSSTRGGGPGNAPVQFTVAATFTGTGGK